MEFTQNSTPSAPVAGVLPRRSIWLEIAIVLGFSLGASAVYSIVQFVSYLQTSAPVGSQTAALNQSASDREWLDVTYQLLSIAFAILPVVLAFYLLNASGTNPFTRLGFTAREPFRDLRRGLVLVLVIGIPGLALYFAGRALGITVNLVLSPSDPHWYTTPLLILSALRAALTEELIVIGFLYERLGRLKWNKWVIIASTAALRGSYHLYQGAGSFFGNFAMGLLFGWLYTRWGRTVPLVITHWILDIASFVGYAWAVATFPGLFNVPAK